MGRVSGLDLLRVAAALVVMVFHVGHAYGYPYIFPRGYLAVDLFFMISGYVMARTYENKFGSSLSVLGFLKKRYVRLWPTMAIGSALGLPILLIHTPSIDAVALIAIANVALIPFPITRTFPLNEPAWSIFFELYANAFHPFLRGTRMFAAVAGSGVLFLWACIHFQSADLGSNVTTLVGGFPRVLFSYGVGALLWRMWQDAPPLRVPLAPVLFAALCSLPQGAISDFITIAFAFPLILAGGLRKQSVVGDALGAPSFPLYAVQRPILDSVRWLGGGPLLAAGLILAVTSLWTIRRRSGLQPVSTLPEYDRRKIAPVQVSLGSRRT